MSQFDFLTMREAFDRFAQQESVRGVICQYGGLLAQELAATPRIRWEPTQDNYALGNRGKFVIHPRFDGTNKLSCVRSKHVREAGASLFLFAKDDLLAEELIAQVVLALEDTFGAEANCRIIGGSWNLARAHSASSERYELRVVVALPVVRILPAALVTATTTTFTPAPLETP